MLVKKTKNKKILFGICLILIGLIIILFRRYTLMKKNKIEQELVSKFYEEISTEENEEEVLEEEQTIIEEIKEEKVEEIEEYVAVINIPKINVERGIYSKYSKNNSVNKTVKILYQSTMPNEQNSNFILASHAGSSDVAYFRNLKYLEKDDYIYIYYDGIKYSYVVDKIFEVDKDGEIEINRVKGKKILTLITCVIGQKKQLVVVANLESEERYY